MINACERGYALAVHIELGQRVVWWQETTKRLADQMAKILDGGSVFGRNIFKVYVESLRWASQH